MTMTCKKCGTVAEITEEKTFCPMCGSREILIHG